MTEPIDPGPVPDVEGLPGEKTPGEYARLCADIDLAMQCARERVEEWDRAADPHGWWHDRSDWIALHNEVVALRWLVLDIVDDLGISKYAGPLDDEDHDPLSPEAWEAVKRIRAQEGEAS